MTTASSHGPKKWTSLDQSVLDPQTSTETLVATSREWIETCTGRIESGKTFIEYLQDGIILCELLQSVVPGSIRKINRIRNPFAWRENLSQFLAACSKLGLKGTQLFSLEDISATSSSTTRIYKSKSKIPGSEKSLRSIALSICHLALEIQSEFDYQGPLTPTGSGAQTGSRVQPLKLTSEHITNHSSEKNSPTPDLVSAPRSLSSSSSSSIGTGRVESVTNLVTETSSTDIQSYAELVLYLNGSSKEYRTVGQPVRLTQSFNRTGPTNTSKKSRVHRTLSDITPLSAKSSPPPYLEGTSYTDQTVPQRNGIDNSEGLSSLDIKDTGNTNSQGSLEEELYPEYGDFDCNTSPSDTSTAVFCELLSSRCSSSLPGPSEDTPIPEKDRASVSDISYNSSPALSRHAAASSDEVTLLVNPSILDQRDSPEESYSRTTPVESESGSVISLTDKVPLQSERIPGSTVELEGFGIIPVDETLSGAVSLERSPRTAVKGDTNSSSGDIEGCNHKEIPKDFNSNSTSPIADPPLSPKPNSLEAINSNSNPSLQYTDSVIESDEVMDRCVHAPPHSNSNHISDQESLGLKGLMAHTGYINGAKDIYGMASTSVMIPHHSLTLASSDPESPSSHQVKDKLNTFNLSTDHHLNNNNYEISSLPSMKNKNLTSLTLGGLDISRVQSDALPQSALPMSLIVDENDEIESKAAMSKFLSDARSIDTCSTDEISLNESPRQSVSPQQFGNLNVTLDNTPRETKISVAGVRGEESSHPSYHAEEGKGRPLSAPNTTSRSVSANAIGSNPITTVPGRMMDKRKSLDVERNKRMINIQENARVAYHYTAKRRSIKSDSLPWDSTSSHSVESMGSDASNNNIKSSSSPGVKSPPHSILSNSSSLSGGPGGSDAAISITPLNLRHLSIEQTKEASLTQMDEIWREVEAITEYTYNNSGSVAERHLPQKHHTALPYPLVHQTDLLDGAPQEIIPDDTTTTDSGMELVESLETESVQDRFSRSEILKESDVVISVMEPVGQSTPLRVISSLEEEGGGVVTRNGPSNSSLLDTPDVDIRSGHSRNRPNSFSNKDIDSLLDRLKSLSVHEEDEDLKMLEDMLKSNDFKKAKHVHDDMRSLISGQQTPAHGRIIPTTQQMREHLYHHTEPSPDVDELRALLRLPDIQAMLFCHDRVSTRDFYVPDAPFHRAAQDPVDIILSASVDNFQAVSQASRYNAVSSRDVPSNRKEGATIVYLERTNRPLGCTIYKQDDAVFIGKLLKGCDAEASDMLREGDELLEVNGIPVIGKSTDAIIRLMSFDVQPGITLAFTIIPVHDEGYDIDYEPKYVRAHFNYDSHRDDEIPCKGLGIAFQKGDILEIVNQDDPNWWQACKVFEENGVSLPGLIPSMHLQQQREAMVRSYPYSFSADPKKGIKKLFSRKKKKKIYYHNTPQSNILGVGDEIPTYEEVLKLEPDPSLCRPIILIGASGVGRNTLIQKLLNSDPSLYQPVVQHTSRLIRPGEIQGHNYIFMSREEFERDVEQDRFLEYEESKGQYCGTAFSSIKKIMESGRVPVLDLHPQALKKIRHSGLKPYIFFVASPRLERLRLTRKIGSEKLKRRLGSSPHHSDSDNQIYTESDLEHLVKESCLIESQYGHYFDWIIVNDDFQVAADMLKEVSRRLDSEPQWVPVAWSKF